MSVTRDEWNARRTPRQARPAANLEVIAREALRAEAVTGDENWDHFLSYIEAAIKAAETQLQHEDAKLRSPYLVNDEAIRVLKAQITALTTRVATLREVIMLPKYLKEHGERAREFLEQHAALARAQIADLAKSS